ncbi:MAG: hypothetical protein HC816_09420 [Leptolyngbyaceae cyanobacterium RM1_1_2]|nr:hypothetical protein [Leptolyngbyaceae cyanobacterium RM1_1_2]
MAIASLIPWLVLVWRYRQQSLEGVGWALQSGAAGFGAQLLTWGLHFTRAFVDFDAGIRFDPSHLFPYLLVVLAIAALLSYALYNLRQQKPRQFWFVLALTAVSALCLILLDLILGGGFSSATRYTVPCLLGATLAIAFCLATQTGQQQPPATRRLWGWIAASLYSLGVLSCISNAFAISGWHKTGGYLPYVAEVINQTPRPLVVADFDLWILPLSHYLKASTAIEMFDSSLGSPQIPPGFSHYFVVNAPADFVTAWAAATDYQLLPLEGLDQVPVWCLQQDAEPTRCPPIARN